MCPTVEEKMSVIDQMHVDVVTTYNAHRAAESRADVIIHARHEVVVCLTRFT